MPFCVVNKGSHFVDLIEEVIEGTGFLDGLEDLFMG